MSLQLPGDPFVIEMRPSEILLADGRVDLKLELVLGNPSDVPAEGIRLTLAMASARPDQDLMLSAFHARPPVPPVADPFDLPARSATRVPGTLSIAGDTLHVVNVGARPMFVPIVMLDIRWRGGLSIRHFSADFMVGTAGQGDKLGPIWLDRGNSRQTGLAMTRYVPQGTRPAGR
ncbi:hypothetical protein ACFQ1E_05390 [Sphingomonas canadensis]|uniref:Uncharacterized protein n=1 Tax=Sphingomonas canadensis TaxID=1219257 RepID=A0ABW3H5Y2_9SPHN|nr:hypothetical protein [Sphingomonas canadensis]